MHIESVGNQEHGAFKSMVNKKAEEHLKKEHAKIEQPTDAKLEAKHDEGHEHDGQQPGVLRLLEEGHFKGVADVRLRINFFDELSSRSSSQAVESLPNQTQSLTEQVAAEFANVLGTLGFDEQTTTAANQLIKDFTVAGQEAAVVAVTDGKLDNEVLQTKLREAFDTLVSGLRSLTAQPEPQPSPLPETLEQIPVLDESTPPITPDVDELDYATDEALPPASTEQVTASASPAEASVEPPQADVTEVDPFASLTQVFDSAIATLNQSLAAIFRLPDPRPSSGHGAAYDKFLAIYNAMRDGNSPSNDDQDGPNVELSA